MKQVEGWWLPDHDKHISDELVKTPEGFQIDRLEGALKFVKSPQNKIALDIGAHVGTWTRRLCRDFKAVHAFEPVRDVFDCLRRNAATEGNVHLHSFGLFDRRGRWSVDTSYDETNTGSRFLREDPIGDLMTFTLDEFLLEDVGFIKIDVEGAEYRVLKGGMVTIARCKPVIVVECKRGFASRFGDADEAVRMLLENAGARLVARYRADHVYTWR